MNPAIRSINTARPRHNFSGLRRLEMEKLEQEHAELVLQAWVALGEAQVRARAKRVQHQQDVLTSLKAEQEALKAAEVALKEDWNAREERRQRIRVKVARWATGIGALIGAAYGILRP